MENDFYKILGIDPNAPDREIKRAYYALASRLHPDKAQDPEQRRQNEQQLALVSAAYNVLKDPNKRKEYDIARKETIAASSSINAPTPPLPTASKGVAAPTPPSGLSAAALSAARSKGAELSAQRSGIAERAFAKGMQLLNGNCFGEAVPFFEAALQNDDSKAVYHLKLAVALIRSRGSYTRAVEHANRALEMDPYNLEYRIILADIHETAGAITAARKIYEEVLKWEPNNQAAKMRLQLLDSQERGGGFLKGLLKRITKK